MKRPPLLDLALLVSALGLGSYLALTAQSPTTLEFKLREENILPAFSAESIVGLRWELPHAFALSRDPESQAPTQYLIENAERRPADEEAVRSLLGLLDLASFKRTLGNGSHLKEDTLGFDRPQLEMRIDAGPRSYRIVAGAPAPAPPNSVYLKVEGTNVETQVGVVDESVVTQLSKTEQEFLGGLVFPLARSETGSLKLTSDKGTVHLVPDKHTFFLESSTGHRAEADRELVDLVFFQLSRTKIDNYLESAPSGPMPVRVEQQSSRGTYVAELGAPCPGDPNSILVHRQKPEELIGCTSRSVLAALLIEETRLRSHTATSMNPDEIDHVIIRSGEHTLDFLREGQEYKLLSRDRKTISREAGDEFLRGLASARLAPVPKAPKDLTLTGEVMIKGQVRNTALSDEKDGTDHSLEVRLEVYRAFEELYLQRKSDASFWLVPESEKWLFLPSDEWARERKVASFSPAEIARVRITLPGGESWEVKRDEESLVLPGPPNQPADPALARELLQTLAELEAVRYVTPAEPRPEAGLLHLDFDVNPQLDKPGTVKTWNLWIGSRVRGGYLSWSDLTEGTFVLPLSARLPIETPLVDRRVFRVNLEEQIRITLEAEGRKIEFERQGGVLRSVGGDANDAMTEPLAEALDALRVVSAAGKHPSARNIQRGKPELTVRATQKTENSEGAKNITLHLGTATVWQGISCRIGWIEGGDESYFVEEASLAPLRELL